MGRKLLNKSLLFIALLHLSLDVALSAIPHSVENLYVDSVVLFQDKKYQESLLQVQEGLKIQPDQKELLELKGLNEKALKKWSLAESTYRRLIALEKEKNKQTPYLFELGITKIQQGKNVEARVIFQDVLQKRFNIEPCELYLGEIAQKEKNLWLAQRYYLRVASSDNETLKLPAHLYLSSLLLEARGTQLAYENLYSAYDLAMQAKEGSQSPVAIATKAELDRIPAQAYLNISLTTGYDSNVLLYPNSALASPTDFASLKEMINLTLGYNSNPSKPWSFQSSYASAFNYNFKPETQANQFFTHQISLTGSRYALATNNFSLLLNGTYTLKNSTSSGFSLGNFSNALEGGLQYQHRFSPILKLQIQALGNYQSYTDDASVISTDLKRSGMGGALRLRLTSSKFIGAFNPYLLLTGEISRTEGVEFRSKAGSIEVGNSVFFSPSHRLQFSLSGGYSLFDERTSGTRTDIPIRAALSYSYDLTRNLVLLISGDYRYNNSNVTSSYLYQRWTSNIGLSYQI